MAKSENHIAIQRLCAGIKLLFLSVLMVALSTFSSLRAQSSEKWVEKGNLALEAHDYQQALDYYLWAAKDTSNLKANLGVANCYRALAKYQAATPYFEKAVRHPAAPPSSYFYLGQCYMVKKRYDLAEECFKKYAVGAKSDPNMASFQNVEALVKMVKADSSEYEIQKLPFNSNFSDFSPAYFNNGILFSSARPNDLGVIHTSTVNDAPLIDLYFAEVDSKGKWSRPHQLMDLNSNLNEGPLVFDSLNHILYLTRNDPDFKSKVDGKDRIGLNRLMIESYQLQNAQWIKAANPFPFNDVSYAIGHPALSRDAKTMVFASDMPGGFGGTDLYRSNYENGKWSRPKNLGSAINTSGNELFPSIGADGLLYFASNGHVGLGGLDIFFARPNSEESWSSVQNIGYPLNSEMDDFGIIVDKSGNEGYFSSNRGKNPEDDNVYSFKRSWPIFECAQQQKNNYCFLFWETGVLDDDTLPLAYEWNFGDGTTARGLSARHCFDGPGIYHVELNLIDTVSGFFFLNTVSSDYEIKDIEQVFIEAPDAIEFGQELTLNAGKSIYNGCTIENYFWEINDGFRAKGVEAKHLFEACGEYEIRLGVTGLPNEEGKLVCKQCVTKKILVLPPNELKILNDSLEQVKRRMKPDPTTTFEPGTGQMLNQKTVEFGNSSSQYNPPAGEGKSFTVLLHENPDDEILLPKNIDGFEDLRRIKGKDNYEYHFGLTDSLKQIIPYYKKAKELGFQDALVVKVDSVDGNKPQITIPARQTDKGYTLFAGQILDDEGAPMEIEISIADFERNIELYRQKTDHFGNFEIELENGRIYTWSAEKQSFFPANGHLDLSMSDGSMNLQAKVRKQIQLIPIEKILTSGQPVVLENIFFDFDKATLREQSFVQLNVLARILAENPDIKVELSAHTDNVGDDAYNFELSRRRAFSVLRYLISNGIDVSRLSSRGMGETEPRVANDSDVNRQLNRRVEFIFKL